MLVSWTCFRIIHASSCFPFWRRQTKGQVSVHISNIKIDRCFDPDIIQQICELPNPLIWRNVCNKYFTSIDVVQVLSHHQPLSALVEGMWTSFGFGRTINQNKPGYHRVQIHVFGHTTCHYEYKFNTVRIILPQPSLQLWRCLQCVTLLFLKPFCASAH